MVRSLSLVALAALALLAFARSSHAQDVELTAGAGGGLRATPELAESGYQGTDGVPGELAIDGRAFASGGDGLLVRGVALRDTDRRWNQSAYELWLGEAGYARKLRLVGNERIGLVLTPHVGFAAGYADASGPANVGKSSSALVGHGWNTCGEWCDSGGDGGGGEPASEKQPLGDAQDHAVVGPSTGVDLHLYAGGFLVGAGLDYRALGAVDQPEARLHHALSLHLRVGARL